MDITRTSLDWRWRDRIDANDHTEYNWKENSWLFGGLEVAVDAIGDKLLGASFQININFRDSANYYLLINSWGNVAPREVKPNF